MAKPKKRIRKLWPIWKLVLVDLVVLGVALCVFALFDHVIPRREASVGMVSQRVSSAKQTEIPTQAPATATLQPVETPQPTATMVPVATDEIVLAVETPAPTAEPTPEPTATPEPTPDPVGYFGTKFADKFTDGEVIREGSTYRSGNVYVSVSQIREKGADVYIADIYIKDISCLQSAFGKDTFGRGYADWPWKIAERKGSIVAINGDYYGTRDSGVVIRNGVLYRDDPKITRDVCVIYWDGSMECFSPGDFNAEFEMERGAYQAWNFGPMLLNADGKAMEVKEFNASDKIKDPNPRAVLGYYEPGHYCMIVADGRSNKSIGLSLRNLSLMLEGMGCKAAYNLDGGQTAVMVCGTEVINDQAGDGRQCSDFIMILDEITDTIAEVERG